MHFLCKAKVPGYTSTTHIYLFRDLRRKLIRIHIHIYIKIYIYIFSEEVIRAKEEETKKQEQTTAMEDNNTNTPIRDDPSVTLTIRLIMQGKVCRAYVNRFLLTI